MTVKELKDAIRDWPEVHEDGNPTEVRVSTGTTESSPVYGVDYHNLKVKGEAWYSDLLIVPRGDVVAPKGTLVEVLGYEKPRDWGLPRKGVVT